MLGIFLKENLPKKFTKVEGCGNLATMYVLGTIVDDNDEDAAECMCPSKFRAELDAIGKDEPLELHINSAGGSVFAGVMMSQLIASRKGRTVAYNDGLVASIAGQLYFSCNECKSPANAFFMLHQPTMVVTTGNANDLRREAEILDTLQEGLETTYLSKAREGVTAEQIHAMMNAETWLTGEQAADVFRIELLAPLRDVKALVDEEQLKAMNVKVPPELDFCSARQYAEAEAKIKQVKALVAEVLGAPSKGESKAVMKDVDREKRLWNRAFNKTLLNPVRAVALQLTDEERRVYYNDGSASVESGQIGSVPSRGGVLVSPDQMRTLLEFRKAQVSLKEYVKVVLTNTNHGRWPVVPVQNLKYQEFSELGEIAESGLKFEEVTYTISDEALIIPVSNQLLEDADVDVIDVIGRELSRAAVQSENEKIVSKLNVLLTGDTAAGISSATTIDDYKELNRALYKTLDGVYEPSAKIFVNQDSFLWLSNLEDGQGRPLLQPDVALPNTYYYRGKEIVVIPNTVLSNRSLGGESYAPILVGDLYSHLTLFERKGFELSTSTERYWHMYAFALRSILRFDVVRTDPNAMIALQVKV